MDSTEEEIKVKVFRKERIEVSTDKGFKVSTDEEVKVSTDEEVKVKVFRKEAVGFKEEVNFASEFAVPRLEANQRES